MAFNAPGSTVSALALSVPAAGTGIDKLDAKLAAILNSCKVPAAAMAALGDADVDGVGHRIEGQQRRLVRRVRVLELVTRQVVLGELGLELGEAGARRGRDC